MKELSLEKQIYLCKYHDVDTNLKATMGLRETEVQEYIKKFKQNGLYEQYRNLDEYEYEDIIKKDKKKNRFEKILDKYKFDKNNKGYRSLIKVLELSTKYKNTKELSLEQVFKQIAENLKVKSYIINNDCKRLLDATYMQNKTLFESYDYDKKPTVKEFVIKELKICSSAEIEETEKNTETKESVIPNITAEEAKEIKDTYVKISVKTLMNFCYEKRIFR